MNTYTESRSVSEAAPASHAISAGFVIRKASLADVPALVALINAYATRGVMLPRTEQDLAGKVPAFFVAEGAQGLIGCGALDVYTPTSAEVRSLAVDPTQKARGAGRRLVEAIEEEARAQGLHSLFAFTYVTGFFEKLGFTGVDRAELPLKVWKDCLRCPKFQACDEVAMIKRLSPAALHTPSLRPDFPGEFVILPMVRKN